RWRAPGWCRDHAHWRLHRRPRRRAQARRQREAADGNRLRSLPNARGPGSRMIQLTREFVRRWLGHLLHIDDTPERTAAAFALGVFFGFSPMLGLHTILGIVFAFLLNMNRVAVMLGVYSNLPWIIGPYYAFATMVVGAPITRHKIPPGFKARVGALF